MQHNFVVSHMTELLLTNVFCFWTLGTELKITQLCMRKYTRCCLLQTSTANPYSGGTVPQTVPGSSAKGTRPVWPNFTTNNRVHPLSWQQITDQLHDMKQKKTQIHTCAHAQNRKNSRVEMLTQQLGCSGHNSEVNSPRATWREVWCYPAQ